MQNNGLSGILGMKSCVDLAQFLITTDEEAKSGNINRLKPDDEILCYGVSVSTSQKEISYPHTLTSNSFSQ